LIKYFKKEDLNFIDDKFININDMYIINSTNITKFINDNLYYKILIVLLKCFCKNKGCNTFELVNICNKSILNEFKNKDVFNSFNINVKNKIILHLLNDNLYINDQESGSCSWFSLYWPLVFYNILINNSFNRYYNYIIHIYSWLKNITEQIFTKENFTLEYYKNASDYNLMKIYCKKFVDIKILDNNILINEIEFIYNNNLYLLIKTPNSNKIEYVEDILNIYDLNSFSVFIHDYLEGKGMLFDSFCNFFDNYDKNRNQRWIMIFNLYLFDINFMKLVKVNISDEDDHKIINILNLFNKTFDDNDTSYMCEYYISMINNINEYYNFLLKKEYKTNLLDRKLLHQYDTIKIYINNIIKYVHRISLIFNLFKILPRFKIQKYLSIFIISSFINDISKIKLERIVFRLIDEDEITNKIDILEYNRDNEINTINDKLLFYCQNIDLIPKLQDFIIKNLNLKLMIWLKYYLIFGFIYIKRVRKLKLIVYFL
jgi:hypothetical protein